MLIEAMGEVRAGSERVALVDCETGIGKSTLVERFCAGEKD